MKKRQIVGTALLMLMTGDARADGEPSAEGILEDQLKKQHHGIFKLNAIILKNLDAKGNQTTWLVEGGVSSSGDLYTRVGQLADCGLPEQTWTKGKPVRFSMTLTSKGTPASGRSANFHPFQATANDRGRMVDDTRTSSRHLIVNSEDFNYRFNQLESVLNTQKNSTPALEEEVKTLDKQMVATQKAADTCWEKGANGKQMTRKEAFKKIHQQRDEFNKQDNSEAFAAKYDKEIYQPAIAACHKQGEEYYEVLIQQRRDFDVNEQW